LKLPAEKIQPNSGSTEIVAEIPVKNLQNILLFWKEFKSIEQMQNDIKKIC
jgi:hypothetical protein